MFEFCYRISNDFALQSVYSTKIQVTSGIFHGIPREVLRTYFIPCHIKYSGQHNHCDIPAGFILNGFELASYELRSRQRF